jgi:hypothetical protein
MTGGGFTGFKTNIDSDHSCCPFVGSSQPMSLPLTAPPAGYTPPPGSFSAHGYQYILQERLIGDSFWYRREDDLDREIVF